MCENFEEGRDMMKEGEIIIWYLIFFDEKNFGKVDGLGLCKSSSVILRLRKKDLI